jgi:hypothetical protein
MNTVLTLAEERATVPIETFSVEENAGQHDMVTLTLQKRPDISLLSGSTVRLQQFSGLETFDFFGYLDTALPYNNGDGQRGGIYFLLAASTALRSGVTRTWNNRSPFEIASNIVERHGLGLEMDKYAGRIGHFAQSTESDWEALRNLANDIGFILTADNSVVRIIDPNATIRRAESQALAPLTVTQRSKFIMEESLTPIGYESYEFMGVDKFGVSFNVKVNDDSPVQKLVREEVESLADALAAAARVESRGAAQNRATFTTDYHPSIHVGHAILVDEGSRLRHWFVLSAKHSYNGNPGSKSMTTLSLCRTSNRFASPAVPRALKRPDTILSDGKWRASYSWTVEL